MMPTPVQPSTVAVIDDSPSALSQMLALLRTISKCAPVGFTDPEEGLRYCLNHDISLVVVDYEMPGINGVRFVESFRDDTRKASVPVVMVTSTADRSVRYSALQVGATDFLGKPIDSVEFVARMNNLLMASRAYKTLAGMSRWLSEEVHKVSTVIQQSPVSVMITDPAGHIVYVNPAFTAATGFSSTEVLGHSAEELMIETFGTESREAIEAEIEAGQEWRGTGQGRRKDGSVYWESVRVFAIRDEAGTITNLVSISEDITLHKEYEARLNWQNNYDPVTRLPNGMLAFDRLGQAIAHAERSGGKVAVLRIDIDRFKLVVETLGRAAGDDLLRQAAQRLQATLRPDATLARIDNGDFVLILPDIEELHGLRTAIDTIRRDFTPPFTIRDGDVSISASIGASLYPADGSSATDLLQHAQAAMNTARNEADGGWRLFTPETDAGVRTRMQMESKLRHALAEGELSLHYQPLIEIGSGEILAAEALLRWHNRELGAVPPDLFVPIAEEAGLILPIGTWVAERACRDMAEWSARGLPPLRVAINLSGRQLEDDSLVAVIRRILEAHDLAAERLELEVTEDLLFDHPQRAAARLEELRAMGLHVSLDDVGGGHLPIGELTAFPFDKLKIDRSLVARAADHRREAALAHAIMAMAKSLDLEVVAEGVETDPQLDFLRRCGCGFAQGFLFARPMPAEQFAAVLAVGTRYPFTAATALA